MLDTFVQFRSSNNKISFYGACRAYFNEHKSYSHNIHDTIYSSFQAAARQYEKVLHYIRHCRLHKDIIAIYNVRVLQRPVIKPIECNRVDIPIVHVQGRRLVTQM